jgi:hypothetical protein
MCISSANAIPQLAKLRFLPAKKDSLEGGTQGSSFYTQRRKFIKLQINISKNLKNNSTKAALYQTKDLQLYKELI